MIDDTGAGLVEDWLTRHGVTIRTDARLSKIEDVKGKKRLKFAKGSDLVCDVVIMATGIRTNLEPLEIGADARGHDDDVAHQVAALGELQPLLALDVLDLAQAGVRPDGDTVPRQPVFDEASPGVVDHPREDARRDLDDGELDR